MIDGSDVAVKWKWHLRGVWSEVEGQLCWTPAGHLQPSASLCGCPGKP